MQYHIFNNTTADNFTFMIKQVVFLMMFSCTVYAQAEFPINDKGEIEFLKIVSADSTSAKNNFNKAKLWVANTFRSAQDVIQYENIEEGKLLCKGVILIKSTGMGMGGTIHRDQAGYIYFTLEIGVKDNRVRIRAYDLFHEAKISGGSLSNKKPVCGGMFMTVRTWNSIQLQAIEEMNRLFAEFEKDVKSDKSNDW